MPVSLSSLVILVAAFYIILHCIFVLEKDNCPSARKKGARVEESCELELICSDLFWWWLMLWLFPFAASRSSAWADQPTDTGTCEAANGFPSSWISINYGGGQSRKSFACSCLVKPWEAAYPHPGFLYQWGLCPQDSLTLQRCIPYAGDLAGAGITCPMYRCSLSSRHHFQP